MTAVLPTPKAHPSSPWALYDALVEGVPRGITVTDAAVTHWAAVRTDADTGGLAMTYRAGPDVPDDAWDVRGRDLRDVAALVTSWNLTLAALGAAALNAWYCAPARLASAAGVILGDDAHFFSARRALLADRSVATVGHFGGTADFLPQGCTILERDPRGQDLPDPACEYLLPGHEVVVITGTTLVNKTLPRLLDLARDAHVALVGPSSTYAPEVFGDCVHDVASCMITDPEALIRFVGLGNGALVHRHSLQMFLAPTGTSPTPQEVHA